MQLPSNINNMPVVQSLEDMTLKTSHGTYVVRLRIVLDKTMAVRTSTCFTVRLSAELISAPGVTEYYIISYHTIYHMVLFLRQLRF